MANLYSRTCSLLFLVASFAIAVADEPDCVYTIYVQTGSIDYAGTDSIISARLYSQYGEYFEIGNLITWGGLMGPGYDYFEKGNLDIFSGRGSCLSAPVCKLMLTSDGTGQNPGWYVDYMAVTTTSVQTQCSQQKFEIQQWLAVDEPPYELSTIRDNCASSFKGHGGKPISPVV